MKKEEKLFKKQKMTKKNFLFKKILNYKKIILHTHINPDGDAVGAIFGLKELINDN
jgi:nanoRNase/pAp phosphatase (c-di-AMP/oligoRNAs hydrolase)